MGDKPAAVERQAARSAELQRQVANPETPAAPAPAPTPAEPKPAPNADIERERNARLAAEEAARKAEQRFQVLKGKYDSEVPTLHTQVKELGKKLDELKAQTAQPASPLLTEKDEKTFGADMIDMVKRAAKEAAHEVVKGIQEQVAGITSALDTLKSGVDGVVSTVQQVQTKTVVNETQKFWDAFDALLAAEKLSFDILNEDPEFLSWLNQVDDLSGLQRKVLLQKAQEDLDAQRAARFFINYAKSHPQPDAASGTGLEHQRHPDQGAGGDALKDFNEGKTWKRSDIAKFYDDSRRGLYRGKEDLKRRIENDIAKAQQDGRIRNG